MCNRVLGYNIVIANIILYLLYLMLLILLFTYADLRAAAHHHNKMLKCVQTRTNTSI
jgi:hypothetical protein